MATPMTFERYTGATNGSWYDVANTPKQYYPFRHSTRSVIPGLVLHRFEGIFWQWRVSLNDGWPYDRRYNTGKFINEWQYFFIK